MTEPTRIELDANGIHFCALAMGEGPLLLCLHGFPDDARTWRHQMPVFAKAGYRVVAPFMRGYAPTSASPTGTYQTAALGHDVAALIEALSPDGQAVVFGHDWGALAAYGGALLAPGRIRKLITAAVPYGPQVQMAFTTSYAQQKRSWYMFFFQTFLAEMAVVHDDLRFIRNLWHDWSPEWKFTEADIAPVLETLSAPGVLEAALGYYRCTFNPALQDPSLASDQMRIGLEPIDVPTLYIHGRGDGCMGVEVAEGMEGSFLRGFSMAVIDGAGHFVHCEKPDDVNGRVLRFLSE
ncbi:MAG TPA: alpha/beta hydrolase [Candidatus Limnocylindrales bacterium]|nr:alpha/beta hydrolase [Candidatus Limnocylindrales bacterium]